MYWRDRAHSQIHIYETVLCPLSFLLSYFVRKPAEICTTIHSFIHSFVHSFIVQSVLRQVHSLFPSEFSSQYDLVLPFLYLLFSLKSSSSCSSLLPRPLFTSILPSVACFRRQFLLKMRPTQWPSVVLWYCLIIYIITKCRPFIT